MKKPSGFTLIELLIVVAIIGILSVIASVNYINATIRTKVARVKSEMMAFSTSLELYAVDHNRYPPEDGSYPSYILVKLPHVLTTPTMYISTNQQHDPFSNKSKLSKALNNRQELVHYYSRYDYWQFVKHDHTYNRNGEYASPVHALGNGSSNAVLARKYHGDWALASIGPFGEFYGFLVPDILIQEVYDPTNGMISNGCIYRTQKTPSGSSVCKR